MRRLVIALFAVMLLLTGVTTASAYAQESAKGTIKGQVVNGTEDGRSVAAVEVTLLTYVNDTISEMRTVIADGEGKFQFDGIAREHTYLVSARHMEVDYYYPVAFESGESTTYVEVGVCDVTDNDQTIRIGIAHTVINVEEDGLKITEAYWLVNDSDMTYVGTDGTLVFTMPEGASGFKAPPELIMDYQLLGDNRVTYLVPFPPGERQLAYSYSLAKPDAAEFTIPLKVDYPTDSLEIMVGGENIVVAVSQLAPAEPVFTEDGKRFIHFQGENVQRNTMIELCFLNLSESGGSPLLVVGIIIAVLVVGITAYLIRKKRRAGSDE